MSNQPLTLCQLNDSVLVVVDTQERLARVMPEETLQRMLHNTGVLLQAATLLNVPVLMTLQYPKGLGPAEGAILKHLPEHAKTFEKTQFSCCGAEGFLSALHNVGKQQVIITGMEAHVCVLQTALELLADEHEVFVVEDAVCSQIPNNYRNAMHRLTQAGVVVSNMQSVLFEWLRDAKHEHFKAVSKLLK